MIEVLEKNKIMKLKNALFIIMVTASSCANNKKQNTPPIIGTWQLVAATSTEKGQTISTFNAKQKMIKIINQTHFAFLNHDVDNGKDSANSAYSAGGGVYTLADSIYTEHLEYFNNRQWENNTFQFVIEITGDTLIQRGIEKVDKLGVDHMIIEKYIRIKS